MERFTHITVDSALTKYQDADPIHIIFVALRSGSIKKLSHNPKSKMSCLVEILHPFAKGRSVVIHDMKLWPYTNAIYLATQVTFFKIPILFSPKVYLR